MIKVLVPVPLGSLTREVDANVAWRALGDDIPMGASWGVPVYVVREWITEALRAGDYRTASVWSALLRRRPFRVARRYVLDVTDGSGSEPLCDARTWPLRGFLAQDVLALDGISESASRGAVADARERAYEPAQVWRDPYAYCQRSPYTWAVTAVTSLPLV